MTELWDDSALVSAFNSAMARYKNMNNQKSKGSTSEPSMDVAQNEAVSLDSKDRVIESDNQVADEEGKLPSQGLSETLAKDALEASEKVESSVDNSAYKQEGPQQQAYAGGCEEYEQIVMELQHITQQQHKLQKRLAHIGGAPYRVSGASDDYLMPQDCSNVAHDAYPCSSVSQEGCYSCQWYNYYNNCATSSGEVFQCQDCGYAPIPNSNDHHTSSGEVFQCQDCGYAPIPNSNDHHIHEEIPYFDSRQKLPDSSSTLPDLVRAAVSEAMKAGAENQSGEINQTMQGPAGLSDVAVAWFLAGFHTSRYLSSGGET